MIISTEKKLEARAYYLEALKLYRKKGGFYAGFWFTWFHYTAMVRDIKDLDIFLLPADYPKILKNFAKNGFVTELTDVRWLEKVFKENFSWVLFSIQSIRFVQ